VAAELHFTKRTRCEPERCDGIAPFRKTKSARSGGTAAAKSRFAKRTPPCARTCGNKVAFRKWTGLVAGRGGGNVPFRKTSCAPSATPSTISKNVRTAARAAYELRSLPSASSTRSGVIGIAMVGLAPSGRSASQVRRFAADLILSGQGRWDRHRQLLSASKKRTNASNISAFSVSSIFNSLLIR
jgi:hypothetical protein